MLLSRQLVSNRKNGYICTKDIVPNVWSIRLVLIFPIRRYKYNISSRFFLFFSIRFVGLPTPIQMYFRKLCFMQESYIFSPNNFHKEDFSLVRSILCAYINTNLGPLRNSYRLLVLAIYIKNLLKKIIRTFVTMIATEVPIIVISRILL